MPCKCARCMVYPYYRYRGSFQSPFHACYAYRDVVRTRRHGPTPPWQKVTRSFVFYAFAFAEVFCPQDPINFVAREVRMV